MGRLIAEQFEAFRLEQENLRRARREQKIKPKPPDNTSSSTWSSSQKTSHAPKSTSYVSSDYQQANDLQLFRFYGKRNYLEWERNMDDWFHYNRILKEKRLAHAIRQLTGDAYKWWVQEVDDRWSYKESPVTSWRELKELMRNKYAPKSLVRKEAYSPQPKEVSMPVQTKKMEPKSTTQPNKVTKQAIVHKQSQNPSLETISERPQQCKSSDLSKSKEVTCYNSRKKGHFAANCPEKHELNITSLGSKLSSQNSSSEVVNQGVETSSSCVMHLVLSKNVDSGHTMEHKDDQAEGSIKEKNPHSVSTTSQACRDSKCEQTVYENRMVIKLCPAPATCESDFILFKAEMLPNILHGTKVSLACEYIRYWNNSISTRSFKQPVLNVEISSLMHLILPLSAKEDTSTLDVCNGLKGTTPTRRLAMDQKEKPPDVSPPIKTRGNYLDSQKRMKANLLSLGADCTMESSKKFQEKKTSLVPLPAYEFYLDKIKLKGNHEQGKESNLFAMVSKVSDAEYFDHKIFVSLDKFSCVSNLTPVPPSELNKFLQDSSLGNNSRKLPFDNFHDYSVILLYDNKILVKFKEKLEELLAEEDLNITAKEQPKKEEIFHRQGNKKQCRMIFKPGESFWNQIKRGRFPTQTKIKLMPRSLQEIKEEPPDSKIISSNCFVRTGIGDVFMQLKEPLPYFRMIFEVGERVWTPRIDGSFHLARRNINNAYQLDLRGKHPIMLLFDGSNLVLFVAGQTDLRTNPFQLGEDDVILKTSKDLEHGAWMGKEVIDEHRAKGAWKALIGPKTCSRTKKYHQACRVLLRQAMTQEDHLSYKDGTKTSLVKVHAQGAWQVTMKHTNTLFPFSSVFPKWFSGERFLMRFVGFMSHLCHLLRLIHLGPFTSS